MLLAAMHRKEDCFVARMPKLSSNVNDPLQSISLNRYFCVWPRVAALILHDALRNCILEGGDPPSAALNCRQCGILISIGFASFVSEPTCSHTRGDIVSMPGGKANGPWRHTPICMSVVSFFLMAPLGTFSCMSWSSMVYVPPEWSQRILMGGTMNGTLGVPERMSDSSVSPSSCGWLPLESFVIFSCSLSSTGMLLVLADTFILGERGWGRSPPTRGAACTRWHCGGVTMTHRSLLGSRGVACAPVGPCSVLWGKALAGIPDGEGVARCGTLCPASLPLSAACLG